VDFGAFKVGDGKVIIEHIYFGAGESFYDDAISIAKLKYPDLEDLVLD